MYTNEIYIRIIIYMLPFKYLNNRKLYHLLSYSTSIILFFIKKLFRQATLLNTPNNFEQNLY